MDTAQSSQDLKAVLEAKLQPFVQDVVASFGLAGLAIGIVKSGELVYMQGFGVRSLNTQEPVTPRSLFQLASVSKTLYPSNFQVYLLPCRQSWCII
jgi:CubicO group peptidase (beta-lactamase class C family)